MRSIARQVNVHAAVRVLRGGACARGELRAMRQPCGHALDQIELDDRAPEAQLGLPLRRRIFQAEVYRSVKGAGEGHTKTYS
jgi:hypothetical protein